MNFLIYLFSMLTISSLFFLYNKKRNIFLLVLVNIIIAILGVSSLMIFVKLNFDVLLIICVCVYILGIDAINYLLEKNEKMKNYLIYSFSFFISSSIWLFLFAFLILAIGILTNTPGV